jgi:hypothetical protein
MFIAALFTISNMWKQPRCPTAEEWIKKMWYLYTMEFYSATKKNEILSLRVSGQNWRTASYVKLSRLRRPKAACSLSYVKYRRNTITAIL